MTCPIAGLDRSPQLPLDPNAEIAELHRREIPAASFLRDRTDRFSALSDTCTPDELFRFSAYQTRLSERIASMSAEAIGSRLHDLYSAAYRFDPRTRTMTTANPGARRELDLWVHTVYHRAYADAAFLNRINARAEIPRLVALAQAHLSPRERGWFHRIQNHMVSEAEILREIVQDDATDIEFLRNYDGATPYLQTSFYSRGADLQHLLGLYFGRDRVDVLTRPYGTQASVDRIVRGANLQAFYEPLARLPNETLLMRFYDLAAFVGDGHSPAVRRNAVREAILIGLILGVRGQNLETAMRRQRNQDAQNVLRFTAQETEAVTRWSGAQNTSTRLDDYEARHGALSQFDRLYRQLLSQPLDVPALRRYDAWARVVLNRSISGIPIFMEDIDRVRQTVRTEAPPAMEGPVTWGTFIQRDATRPHWYRPADFETGPRSPIDIFNFLRIIPVDGRPLAERARAEVDFIYVTANGQDFGHASGAAMMIFGIVILNGEEFAVRPGFVPSVRHFFSAYAHEVGHHVYTRGVFDRASERLLWQGFNERFGFLYGLQAMDGLFSLGLEGRRRPIMAARTEEIVRMTNQRLGLPPRDFSLDPLDPRVSYANLFYPTELAGPDLRPLPTANTPFPAYPVFWSRIEASAAAILHLDPADSETLRRALSRLNALTPDQLSETFHGNHVLLRLLNSLRQPTEPEITHTTFSAASWARYRERTVGGMVRDILIRQRNETALAGAPAFWRQESRHHHGAERRTLDETIVSLESPQAPFPIVLGADHPLVDVFNRRY